MSKPTVLRIGSISHTEKEWSEISSTINLVTYRSGSREDFVSHCQRGKYNEVVAICRTNDSTAITGRFNETLVSYLPQHVKFICHNGAGYDSIDIEACTRRGIEVSNTPIAVNNATADVALFLLLGALRRISIPLRDIREGRFDGDELLGHDPEGKVLGIVGMGGIGKALAKRARALGMIIQYHNRRQLDPSEAEGAKHVSFDQLISQSDVISLNLELNPSTRHIISASQFEKMKDGVVIINTARGGVMDENALVAALNSGKVYSAGLDVYENEPKIHPELLKNNNVVLLPHIGTSTYETQAAMERLVLSNLKSALKNGRLITGVSEQAEN